MRTILAECSAAMFRYVEDVDNYVVKASVLFFFRIEMNRV